MFTGNSIKDILSNLYKYYTTDGVNISGKSIGLNASFSKYYRLHYGAKEEFIVKYKSANSNKLKVITLNSIGYQDYFKRFFKRYSLPYDKYTYKSNDTLYYYKEIDKATSKLVLRSFSMGNASTKSHKTYVRFLDSIFNIMKLKNTKNLIIDLRLNSGGTDPNDLVTYSYLTNRPFMENKKAFINFQKIPYTKYIKEVFFLFKPILKSRYQRMIREEFPEEISGKFYQDSTSADHKIRYPNMNAFKGTIYLLIGPSVASAASLFGAMVAGNKNTVVIGEESMGAYYGHNGHTPMRYTLPKSKIKTSFSLVNLEQDVPKKANQIYNRGIIPDYYIKQSYEDFFNHTDAQMDFTMKLIKQKSK